MVSWTCSQGQQDVDLVMFKVVSRFLSDPIWKTESGRYSAGLVLAVSYTFIVDTVLSFVKA